MYHRVCARSDSNWSYIEQDHLRPNDAVIISAPFSDLGKVHPRMEEVLSICDDLHIPVLLDLAYICISKNIDIDVTHPCIETITSSISKAFYGAQYLRAGIRWQKQDLDDGIDVSNSVDMVSMPSLAMAVRYIELHSLDWLWTRYEKIYHDVLQEFDLAPTNCILFGLGGDRYSDYNRGNVLNRVCISQEIGERYASMQSQ